MINITNKHIVGKNYANNAFVGNVYYRSLRVISSKATMVKEEKKCLESTVLSWRLQLLLALLKEIIMIMKQIFNINTHFQRFLHNFAHEGL